MESDRTSVGSVPVPARRDGLCLALPNGSLLGEACSLLAEAGIVDIEPEEFDRHLLIERNGYRLLKARPTDVPVYVEMGASDCGIVGKDILWESARDWYELLDLRFGHCRMVLAAPEGSPMARGDRLLTARIATKYPHTARRYFDELGISAELIKLHGSVELAPLTGLSDAILDLTASGRTLRANRLVEVAEAGRATARFIVNQASLKTRSDAVTVLVAALRRAVEARQGATTEDTN